MICNSIDISCVINGAGNFANAASMGANTVAFKSGEDNVDLKPVLLIAAFNAENKGNLETTVITLIRGSVILSVCDCTIMLLKLLLNAVAEAILSLIEFCASVFIVFHQ